MRSLWPGLLLASVLLASLVPFKLNAAPVNTPLYPEMPAPAAAPVDPPGLVALGRQLFFDTRLSEPRGTSCASCHAPAQAFSGNHGSRIGVALGSRPASLGTRNTPSVLYLRYTPPRFFYQDDDALAPIPFGGFFWDGRANTLVEQVQGPLFNPLEMNNRDASQLARKLQQAYALDMRAQFGAAIFQRPAQTTEAAGRALEAFLRSDEMTPFSSRYDDYIRGRVKLTTAEMRGLRLFKDPDKGNCASCHKFNDSSSNPARSLFTDFGYDAVAVPRNRRIAENRNPKFYDVGLCKTAAQLQWHDSSQWCGYFKTPSLRNVAVRENYMHNGVFSELRDAVAFYATRATKPGDWYKSGVKFDDVPPAYRENVNINSVPYNRREGSKPALSDSDVDDLVTFLKTLTDAAYVRQQAGSVDK
ncbi:Cytochrome c peroxidase [Collimonas sp. OK307]|uniref:cytochrome-c peroxidase n=1 Tax=Collimonas sp. OK307 TaxID=1801620 RepID=UPI0008E674B4|nr:cytochrome c peroxidase [Collimonas sp. OK307]SFH84212.1 Cytochrome c peroxidase [Collimonas sp. OK307]